MLAIVGVYVLALVINLLAATFGGEKKRPVLIKTPKERAAAHTAAVVVCRIALSIAGTRWASPSSVSPQSGRGLGSSTG